MGDVVPFPTPPGAVVHMAAACPSCGSRFRVAGPVESAFAACPCGEAHELKPDPPTPTGPGGQE